jgi:hypothetical protein
MAGRVRSAKRAKLLDLADDELRRASEELVWNLAPIDGWNRRSF